MGDRYSDEYYRREYGVSGRQEFIEGMRTCNAHRQALIFAFGDDFVEDEPEVRVIDGSESA